VVGGGNVAIDVARSLWRYRKDVTVVYRREKCDMPANDAEIREAEAEGIRFHFMSAPAEVMVDADNQVKGLEGRTDDLRWNRYIGQKETRQDRQV